MQKIINKGFFEEIQPDGTVLMVCRDCGGKAIKWQDITHGFGCDVKLKLKSFVVKGSVSTEALPPGRIRVNDKPGICPAHARFTPCAWFDGKYCQKLPCRNQR